MCAVVWVVIVVLCCVRGCLCVFCVNCSVFCSWISVSCCMVCFLCLFVCVCVCVIPNEPVRWDSPSKNQKTEETRMISRKQRFGAEIWVQCSCLLGRHTRIFYFFPSRACSVGCTFVVYCVVLYGVVCVFAIVCVCVRTVYYYVFVSLFGIYRMMLYVVYVAIVFVCGCVFCHVFVCVSL